ncbi:hypothetical protein BGZ65_012265 [Modicella reniformis]|uniref:Uncharacterized protein n=1 Tax=Modicella reniformis TaxID=1440133 RepID=A0A9P6MJP0_9FUNG|nr:hypothetical protein BGZ65_012265 [Modicella reniformis]
MVTKVFSDHYFRHGLCSIPQYGRRVVKIPDINLSWIRQNILVPYRSSYVLQVLNSLLYLRLSSLSKRERDMAAHEQALLSDQVSAMDITPSPMSSNDIFGSSCSSSVGGGGSLGQANSEKGEIKQQKRIQCLIHGDETNIDEDMWRLLRLWREVRQEEDELIKGSGSREKHKVRSSSFPRNGPRLQLLLKSDESYLQVRPGVRVFDEYEDVPEGKEAPPAPILASFPSHPPQYHRQEPEALHNALASESSPMVESSPMMMAAHESTMSDLEDTFMDLTTNEYAVIDLPDIEGLRIQE